jgi:flagellar biosynthesis chaperone FliJ
MNPDVDSTPFTFRLERVKSLRERAEDQAREELGRTLTHRVRGEALVRQAADAREREAIERLERRRRADHEAEMGRRAQAALDEVALTVHRRGTAG